MAPRPRGAQKRPTHARTHARTHTRARTHARTHTFAQVVLPVLKRLLSPKLRARLVIVNGAKSKALYTYFPQSSLTEEHGGNFNFDHTVWASTMSKLTI